LHILTDEAPIVGIAVDVDHLNDASAEIAKAKELLKTFELDNGVDVDPCTPDDMK
jgi:hypothetical protein